MANGYPSFRELAALLPPPDYEGMKVKVLAAVDRVKHLEYLGSGRGRLVYATEHTVFKIPYTINAESCNRYEAQSYRNDVIYRRKTLKAKCRLIKLCGLDVIAMERLSPVSIIDTDLHFELEAITRDGDQCGADKHGNVKVYDYEAMQIGAGEPVINVYDVTGCPRHESPTTARVFPEPWVPPVDNPVHMSQTLGYV